MAESWNLVNEAAKVDDRLELPFQWGPEGTSLAQALDETLVVDSPGVVTWRSRR